MNTAPLMKKFADIELGERFVYTSDSGRIYEFVKCEDCFKANSENIYHINKMEVCNCISERGRLCSFNDDTIVMTISYVL